MKEKILNKITEMENELDSVYEKIDTLMVEDMTEFDSKLIEADFFYGYDGESNSHVLDIIDENMYILRKLKSFIETLDK